MTFLESTCRLNCLRQCCLRALGLPLRVRSGEQSDFLNQTWSCRPRRSLALISARALPGSGPAT